jgi:hypothetical protein
MKSAMLVLTLIAIAFGATACAKYPVVVGTRAEAPAPVSTDQPGR